MPLITINNPNSPALGRLAAWFDTNKPRTAPKKSKNFALKRLNESHKAEGKPRVRRTQVDSYHHLNLDRATPDPENLFACTSSEQHNGIELQHNEWFTQLFNHGTFGFDYKTKKYFLADENLEGKLREWDSKGAPKQWDIRGIHKGEEHGQRVCSEQEDSN